MHLGFSVNYNSRINDRFCESGFQLGYSLLNAAKKTKLVVELENQCPFWIDHYTLLVGFDREIWLVRLLQCRQLFYGLKPFPVPSHDFPGHHSYFLERHSSWVEGHRSSPSESSDLMDGLQGSGYHQLD